MSSLKDFDHPCRDTCSGWKQGYDKGKGELYIARDEIERQRRRIIEVNGFLHERSQECEQLKVELEQRKQSENGLGEQCAKLRAEVASHKEKAGYYQNTIDLLKASIISVKQELFESEQKWQTFSADELIEENERLENRIKDIEEKLRCDCDSRTLPEDCPHIFEV